MAYLLVGLILFLGTHSLRIFAPTWLEQNRARFGDKGWKGIHSVLSVVGLIGIVVGFGAARADPVIVWLPPVALRHIAVLFTLGAFVLISAAYIPGNSIKARLHHPLILGVKLWAFAHLLANGRLADLVLFGSFLLWAILDFRASRQRDRIQGTVYAQGTTVPTVITFVVGCVAWALFAFWAHLWLIGVAPLAISR